jgi:hypothetical protein
MFDKFKWFETKMVSMILIEYFPMKTTPVPSLWTTVITPCIESFFTPKNTYSILLNKIEKLQCSEQQQKK